MAKEFLSQLLKIENSVQSDDRQRCTICLEEIGSLSSETGIIECQIRLPCNHLVGSHCIATWLHDNNTCPVCRSAFFPAQPRPYLEHGVMQDDVDSEGDGDGASDDDSEDDQDDQDRAIRLARNTEWFTRRLGLNYVARVLSVLVARRAFHMDALRDCSRCSKAAVSIWVASHLVHHPVTLERVSTVMEITQRTILDTYRLFYPERETVIDRECLFLLREDPERATMGDLPILAWPIPESNEDWRTDVFWQTIASRLGTEPERTLTLRAIMELSRALVLRLVHRTYLNANSVIEIAALSIHIASCMRGVPISCGQIASATGVSEGDIRTIYALFYPHREDLLDYRTVTMLRSDGSFERLLDFLPREVPPSVEQGRIVDGEDNVL